MSAATLQKQPVVVVVPQGRFLVRPARAGAVQIKFKPLIWPEVMITLEPLEAAALVDAVGTFL